MAPSSKVWKLGTRRSDRSWEQGKAEDEDFDPFADVSIKYILADVRNWL
jgi:hypothetical protein